MTGDSALGGIRVVEITHGLAGRTAGALLADLGAEVVQFPADGTAPNRNDPSRVWSDRRKVIHGVGGSDRHRLHEQRGLLGRAHVLLSDLPPSALERFGLDAVTTREQNPSLVHAWMPPFGLHGRWSGLNADALLLAAVCGYADHYPAETDRPVAPAVPTFLYLQGAIGAAAVIAGLVARERSGVGTAVRVSGLDAMGAALATLMMQGLDAEALPAVGRSVKGVPSFRLYQGGDGAWFFLAALTPSIFIRALEAIGRLDIFVRDDVAGEFANLMLPAVRGEVNAEMETTFASKPAQLWLDIFRAANVPAAPVWSREAWLQAQIVPAGARHAFADATFGTITVPDPPVNLPGTPMLSEGSSPPSLSEEWQGPVTERTSGAGKGAPLLPLAGIKVIDICSFLAGPFVATLLADFGAEVVKVEPVDGDPYSVFAVSHAIVNQAKKMAALDLRDRDARAAFLQLLRGADVLVDNFTPESLDKLGLDRLTLTETNPNLIRCSISAFGTNNEWSTTPGFDPVLQSMTGLAFAQGGAASPVQSSAPVVDVSTGALGAVGVLAALFARCRSDGAQHVRTSLASGAVFVQSGELTSYEGSPVASPGALDYLGPSATRRLYETEDGWIAVAASTDEDRRALFDSVGQPDCSDLGDDEAATILAAEIISRPTEHWLDEFAAAGVPSVRVLRREHAIADPFLIANDFSHLLDVPGMGRFRVVRSYSVWNGVRRQTHGCPTRGRDTRQVLAGAGVESRMIEELIERGAILGG